MQFPRVFLLSPARIGGARSHMLMREEAEFDLAIRLRTGGATVAEIYAFISGLYFRGKLAYADAFGAAPQGGPPAVAIVPGLGLARLDMALSYDQLEATAAISVDAANTAFSEPLIRDALRLNEEAGPECRFVLLGSVASDKYTRTLLEVFGDRLLFPSEFIGRGDMSRGGLMLRCARELEELSYIAVRGAVLRGRRPPKLAPLSKKKISP